MESKKIARMNLFSGQQWRNRRREQTYRHGGRRGGRSMKRVTEIYNTICKIDSQWEFAV